MQRQAVLFQRPAFFSTGMQIKINRNPIVNDLDLLKSKLNISEEAPIPVPECFYPNTVEKIENKTCKAQRTGIRHSVYKLVQVGHTIHGKHIYDAQTTLGHIDKKAADIFLKLLNSARKNGVDQGLQQDKMFVKEVICGKGLMMKQLDIKARGRMGIIRVPKSSVRIVLEEKHPKELYKLMLTGKCPIGLAEVFKTMMHQSGSDYGVVRANAHLTTSKGRYYRRTQFKRLVQLVEKEYQRSGTPIAKSKIERHILEKTANEWYENSLRKKEVLAYSRRSNRQAMFDKSYEKKL